MFTLSKRDCQIISGSGFAVGIISMLLVIILTPCMTEIVYRSTGLDMDYFIHEIVLMVMIPFLLGIIGLFVFDKYREYSLDDLKRSLEKAFRNGAMSVEQYTKSLVDATEYDVKKKMEEIKAKRMSAEAKLKNHKMMKEYKNEIRGIVETDEE